MSTKPLFLIFDGNWFVHRAYHVAPSLTTSKGYPVGAVKLFLSMINKAYYQFNPSYLCVVFDAPGAHFRHALTADYKYVDSDEGAVDMERVLQQEVIKTLLKLMGIPVACIGGVEADDTIATLAVSAEEVLGESVNTLILSADKDIHAVVSKRVRLYNPLLDWVATSESVKAKFGVPPSLIPDYLALVGDSSDNVKGVAGVGAVTAVDILTTYGSVEDILRDPSLLSPKHAKKLTPSALATLRHNLRLTRLKTDVVHGMTKDTLRLIVPDTDRLKLAVSYLEFKTRPRLLDKQINAKSSLFRNKVAPSSEDVPWPKDGNLFKMHLETLMKS